MPVAFLCFLLCRFLSVPSLVFPYSHSLLQLPLQFCHGLHKSTRCLLKQLPAFSLVRQPFSAVDVSDSKACKDCCRVVGKDGLQVGFAYCAAFSRQSFLTMLFRRLLSRAALLA